MICSVCKKPKNTIEPKQSALFPETMLLACETCRVGKLEPRALVVIVGRSKGIAAVREHILKHLYVGDDITAAELTT